MIIKSIASGSSGNCYLIQSGKTKLLIECGIGIKRIQQGSGHQLSEISGCLCSHAHGDHVKAFRDVLKYGIPVYMTRETIQQRGAEALHIEMIQPDKSFNVGALRVLPFETQHDCPGACGFIIDTPAGDRLVYATDTYYIKYKIPGITHLMVEVNYIDEILQANIDSGRVDSRRYLRIRQSHMSLETLVRFLKANDLSRLQETHIIHLSNDNSDERKIKETVQAVTGKPVRVC